MAGKPKTRTSAKRSAPRAAAKGLEWKRERPRRSGLSGATGDTKRYRVEWLEVLETSNEVVGTAVVMLIDKVLEHMPDDLDDEHDVILFAWDTVYNHLTVTFTNERRDDDAKDVFKVFCRGWDDELQNASPHEASLLTGEHVEVVYGLVQIAAEAMAPAFAELGREATVGFTTDVEGASWDPI